MQMNKLVIRHPRWSSRCATRRAAVFKTMSSHSRGGLKQSAPVTRKTCKSPRVYCDRLVPPSPLYVQTRAAINPAGRAANRGKHFILFRSPRGYYVCHGVAWKMLGEWKTGKQRTRRPITRTNGPPSSPPGVNEGVRNALLCPFDYSDDLSVFRPLFSIPHPCHNALPSSINRHSAYFRVKKKEKISIFHDDGRCNNESLNGSFRSYRL